MPPGPTQLLCAREHAAAQHRVQPTRLTRGDFARWYAKKCFPGREPPFQPAGARLTPAVGPLSPSLKAIAVILFGVLTSDVLHLPMRESLMPDSQRQRAIELVAAPPSKAALLNLISWLDLACSHAPRTSFPQQILARAVVAFGYRLFEQHAFPTIARTIQAAEQFASEPTEAHFDLYQSAATQSYPFGPGDGCYALPETGYAGCVPGSGCSSGAGCLALSDVGEGVVMEAIANDLLPWLRNEQDTREKYNS
jgi:hypothetical protein